MEKGYVHVYTGNGKGKTTAAFGLALRAVCSGKKVYVGQFIKGMKYSETKCEDYLPNIEIHQFGQDCFIDKEPTENDMRLANEGYEECKKAISSGRYDVVILDEITIAIYFKLISTDMVLKLMNEKPENVELVITGRYAPDELVENADLVTNMEEVKHYYEKGVLSRAGIDC